MTESPFVVVTLKSPLMSGIRIFSKAPVIERF